MLTCEIDYTLMRAIMLAALWIVPLYTKPCSWLICNLSDVADRAKPVFERQALVDVVITVMILTVHADASRRQVADGFWYS